MYLSKGRIMESTCASVWFVLTTYTLTQGFETFRTKLPNADLVPHPCKLHHTWPGLGHRNPRGGGVRNQFGLDFLAAGRKWTLDLCNMDSDEDGRTNGQELGDPECVWREGEIPDLNAGITHPGVCDPWDSPECSVKNSWVSCEIEVFNCSATTQHHVIQKALKFPRTKVPPTETNYFCMTFELPTDKDYHLIASEPVIDNIRVVHHMRLMGCLDEVPSQPRPERCYMEVRGCYDLIGVWTVGMSGQCLHTEAGFKIGASGYKRVALEIHWNNPGLREDYYDRSGLRIYYTPRLRPFDAGVLWTGQERLFLPPGQSQVTVESTCPSQCTQRYIKRPIYITNALNHMHYLGISEKVEHIRHGKRLQYITNEESYSYDNPVFNVFSPPLVLKPGDSLKTTCTYRTLSTRVTTLWGEGTQDEMCYALLVFYPRSAVSRMYCDSWGDYNGCMVDSNGVYNGCHVCNFRNLSNPETQKIYDKVLKHCDYMHGECRHECPEVLAEVKRHPCMMGDLGAYILHEAVEDGGSRGMKFATALRSCDCPALSERHIGMQDMTSKTEVSTLSYTVLLLSIVFSITNHISSE